MPSSSEIPETDAQIPARFAHLGKPDRVIQREAKGLIMLFFEDRVIKDYSAFPTLPSISHEDQTTRMNNEVEALNRFEALSCPFTPRLLDSSSDERWFAMERIDGDDLHSITQRSQRLPPIANLSRQITAIHDWLAKNLIPAMGTNIKDIVLDASEKLHIVDFESPNPNGDFYHDLIFDLCERLFIRDVRTARLTSSFWRLALGIMIRHPRVTAICVMRCLKIRLKGLLRRGKT